MTVFQANLIPNKLICCDFSWPLLAGMDNCDPACKVWDKASYLMPRPRVRPAYPKGPPPKVAKLPDAPRCTEVSKGCLPNSRCCDPCASCQCRFFNTICFCRKTNSMCGKKA
uniref:Agouti domain-containing protein n=1 Tax=Gadus morhua TaxID=8049 RepID=A0A8C4ZI08_GADMO